MSLVELTSDEVELLTQAYHASLRPNPQDRGFTVTSYGGPIDQADPTNSTDAAQAEAKRWRTARNGLVDKGLFESVNDLSGAYKMTRGGFQRAADMNPRPVPL